MLHIHRQPDFHMTCDEETFNDQARIFATEEEIKEYGKQLLEDKILLMGMKYEKKDYQDCMVRCTRSE